MLGFLANLLVHWIGGRLLAMRPNVRARHGTLVASTSPGWAILTLGLKLRTVVVDPRLQLIRLRVRYAWLITVRRGIPFHAVVGIVYTWTDVNPLQHLPLAVYQELDLFTVSAELRSGEVVVLCRFFGAGDWVNEHFLPDWMFLDDQLAAALARGTQEEASRVYATLVAKMVGVELEAA